MKIREPLSVRLCSLHTLWLSCLVFLWVHNSANETVSAHLPAYVILFIFMSCLLLPWYIMIYARSNCRLLCFVWLISLRGLLFSKEKEGCAEEWSWRGRDGWKGGNIKYNLDIINEVKIKIKIKKKMHK